MTKQKVELCKYCKGWESKCCYCGGTGKVNANELWEKPCFVCDGDGYHYHTEEMCDKCTKKVNILQGYE